MASPKLMGLRGGRHIRCTPADALNWLLTRISGQLRPGFYSEFGWILKLRLELRWAPEGLEMTVAEGRTCAQSCSRDFNAATLIDALNSTCYCLSLDEATLRRGLESDLGARGLSDMMVQTHSHLFASVPMFVSREHIDSMTRVIGAVETVVATQPYLHATRAWAPESALFDPGPRGGLLGYDFHLGPTGPQLIEINTNPGGALLNTVLGRAHRSCCADAAGLAMQPMEADAIEEALFEVFTAEWRLQRKDAPLKTLAIVDEAPEQQYLYPEFLLYRQLFSRRGIKTTICDPRELFRKGGRWWAQNEPVDFVYNRLTDFALEQPAQAALREAYLDGEVVVSPNPRAHMRYADKRNLTLLCDGLFLRSTGVSEATMSTLLAAVPRTEIVTRFLLPLRDDAAPRSPVALPRLQRAIGVIYRPDTERQSHYFYTRLAQQFDAMIHIDETSALEPLDVGQVWSDREAPKTFPSGI